MPKSAFGLYCYIERNPNISRARQTAGKLPALRCQDRFLDPFRPNFRLGITSQTAGHGLNVPKSLALLVLVTLASAPASTVRANGPEALKADKVLVIKHERRLVLLRRGRPLRAYTIALGRNPRGHKTMEGDGRTPEGRYRLDWRNAESRFHRSLHISYPSAADRRQARRRNVSPGGAIMIHGLPPRLAAIGADHAKWDWTEGCIALTNAEINEVWRLVDDGTVIEIRP